MFKASSTKYKDNDLLFIEFDLFTYRSPLGLCKYFWHHQGLIRADLVTYKPLITNDVLLWTEMNYLPRSAYWVIKPKSMIRSRHAYWYVACHLLRLVFYHQWISVCHRLIRRGSRLDGPILISHLLIVNGGYVPRSLLNRCYDIMEDQCSVSDDSLVNQCPVSNCWENKG